jgi:hypothetical protein
MPPKKLMNSGRDDAAWTGHTLHLGNDLFNLWKNVQGQRGNGCVEFTIVESHVADIAVLVCNVRVGSTKAGPFQVSL